MDAIIIVIVKALGAIVLIVVMIWSILWLAWKSYAELNGWPKVLRAVREYNKNHPEPRVSAPRRD